tara:strand:+ start:6547 stop:8868 length:2322 start_codon:yes stop_codon:yes gene_type:complete
MNMFSGRDGLIWWQGIIEAVNDPEALGRVRVRIFGYHSDDRAKIPTDNLPWASPLMPITSASIAGIGQSPTGALPGTWVMGFFRDGENAQDPIIWGTINGKPGPAGVGAPDGSYPSEQEILPGASVTGESDVNKLATGAGVPEQSTSPAGSDNSSGDGERSIDQSGTPSDEVNKKRLTKITSKNGKSTYVATIFAKNFQNFINEFEKTPAPNHPNGYTIYSLGGYVHRKSAAGNGKWSYHASGASIDINPKENPYGSTFITDMPKNTSAMAKKYGLGWGGDWTSSKDAMHFSMATAERGTVKLKRNGIVPDPETGSQDGPTSSGTNSNPSSKYSGQTPQSGPSQTDSSTSKGYDNPNQSPVPNKSVKPELDVTEWDSSKDYIDGDMVRSPKLLANQIGSQPPYTYRTGIIAAAAAMQCSALDFGTVMSYEMGGRWDARRKGPTTKWGQHRGVIQFGEPQAKQYGVDFSTEQTAIDTQLGPNGAVVRYLRAHGVKNGMGRLEIYSAINAGGVGEKYYGRSDAGAGGAKGSVRDKVNNQMDGHEANARRLLNSKDDGQYVEQKVFRATQSGKSSNSGNGPSNSNLKDGTVTWEVAPDEFQEASKNTQNAAQEAAGETTTDGYSTAPTQSGGASQGPKPHSVTEKMNSQITTELFQEPGNPFAAEYPHNKVLFTESGHIQEFDDTPNAERIHTYHRTGTFEEIHPDGTKVIKVVKNNYELILGDDSIYVRGTMNLVVDADVNVKIAGKVNIDVGGTIDSKSGGNTTIKAPRIDLNP